MILQIVNAHSNSWNGMHRYLQVLDTVIETVHPRFFRGSILSSREESSGNWSYLLLKILYQKNIRIEEFQLQFTGSIENAWRCAWCANIQHTLSIQLAESNIYKTFVKNRHLFTWSVTAIISSGEEYSRVCWCGLCQEQNRNSIFMFLRWVNGKKRNGENAGKYSKN